VTRPARRRPFYGWVVVGAVLVMLSMASGLGFYNMTVYLRALTTERGFSVGAVSGATALFFFTGGVAGLPVARLIERFDPRATIAGGAVLGGACLAMLGSATELWHVYVLYVGFGVGFAAAGLVPGITVVTRWFERRRSVALSIASTGLSVGGIVLTPLSANLIGRHGLDAVTPWLGLAFVVGIAPVTLAFVRPDPASLGLRPDGDAAPRPTAAGPVAETGPLGVPYRPAVRSRFFVVVTAAYVLVMLAQVGGLSHHFNLISERLDEARAATAVSVVAGTSVVARLLGGWLATRVSIRALAGSLMVVQAAALLTLAAGSGQLALFAGSVALGLTVGNLLMLHPLLLAEAFGVRDYGRIYSLSQLVMTVGVALGPLLVGAVHDAVGGYGLGLSLAAGASLTASAALLASGTITEASSVGGALPARAGGVEDYRR
jgi:MFS family permease